MHSSEIANIKDYAYYGPDWIWPSPRIDVMKSMLLFFEGITLALPTDLANETISRDPVLAVPLAEKGYLVNIDPSSVLDEQTSKHLAEALTQVVTESNWNPYSDRDFYEATDYLTPMHYGGTKKGFKAVRHFEAALKRRGLIEAVEDAELVRLDPRVRLLVLTMFAQVFRSRLLDRGTVVHPLTDSSDIATGLEITLDVMAQTRFHPRPMRDFWVSPTREYQDVMNPTQISTDLLEVGTDLSDVPLDEVLDFRRENMNHYTAYAAGLREFLVTQATLHPTEQEKARRERRLRIREQAAELRKISRTAFGLRSAALVLALTGAAWTARHGDIFGSMMSGLIAGAQAIPLPEGTVTPYSYLMETRQLR